jgi:hypothetical protein
MMKEKKQKKSFVLFADFMPAIFALSDEQAGKLFKLIFLYANDMDLPQIEDNGIKAMFEMLRTLIDRENEKWEERCRKNRENSHKRKCYGADSIPEIGRHPPASIDNNGGQQIPDVILNDNDSDNENEGLEISVSMKPVIGRNYPFDTIWELYGKPIGDAKALREKWNLLPEVDKAAIYDYVPRYVASRPEVRYRKNFENFLSQRVWETEPLSQFSNGIRTNIESDAARRQSAIQNTSELVREILADDNQPVV